MLYGANGKVVKHTKADYERDKAIVKKFAKSSCKKCYGRGIIGINITTGKQRICGCVNQVELVKELQLLYKVQQELIRPKGVLPSAS